MTGIGLRCLFIYIVWFIHCNTMLGIIISLLHMGKLRPKSIKKCPPRSHCWQMTEAKSAFGSAYLQSFAYEVKPYSSEICINSSVAYVMLLWEQIQMNSVLCKMLGFLWPNINWSKVHNFLKIIKRLKKIFFVFFLMHKRFYFFKFF